MLLSVPVSLFSICERQGVLYFTLVGLTFWKIFEGHIDANIMAGFDSDEKYQTV